MKMMNMPGLEPHSLCCRAVLCSLALAAGCGDPVAGLDYLGDPLATVRGQVLLGASNSAPAGNLFVVLGWRTEADPKDLWTAQTVDVAGGFPASYKLDLLEPPAARALNVDPETGGRLGFAFVALIEDGDGNGALDVDLQSGKMPTGPDRFAGGSELMLLAYAADPFAADSKIGKGLGTALAPGYHLMRADPANQCVWDAKRGDWACANARTQLEEVPLSTPVDLKVIGEPSEWAPVHAPDWLFLQ